MKIFKNKPVKTMVTTPEISIPSLKKTVSAKKYPIKELNNVAFIQDNASL